MISRRVGIGRPDGGETLLEWGDKPTALSVLGPLGTGMTDEIRVLHVDDEPDFAAVTADFLNRHEPRFDVDTAATATEALAALDAQVPDCIVADYDMPGMTGIEFLREVRSTHPDLPVILFTGKGSEEVASEAISAGVSDYLQKESGTSQYDVLRNRIENLVEQSRTKHALRVTEQRLSELAERADDILFVFDGDWSELLFINSAYEEIWGGSIEELRRDPTSYLDYIHSDDREFARELADRLMRGESVEAGYRVCPSDGEVRWVHGSAKPVLDDDGRVVRILGYVRDITALKETEATIHAERRRFQSLAETLPDVVYRADPETLEPTYVNTAIEDIYGYSPQEWLESADLWEESIHSDDVDRVTEQFDANLAASNPGSIEYRIVTKGGDTRWVRDSFGLERDDDGSVTALVGVLSDITERKQYEAELERLTERFQAFTELSADIITVVGREGTIRYQSPAIERVLGYAPEDLVGENVFDYIHPDDRDRVWTAMSAVLETEGATSDRAEYRFKDATGAWRWLETVGTNRTHTAIDGYVSNSREITERKIHEQELERTTQQLDAILAHTETPMFMKARTGEYLLVNQEYLDLFGLAEDEVIGRTDYDLHAEEMADEVWTNDEQVFDTGDPIEIEERILVDGERRVYLASKVPIWFNGKDAGVPDAVFGVATDITERKTHEVLLEEFASVVSHDLRNPLNVAMGRIDLVAEECSSEHVVYAIDALERMEEIIEDVLAVAREGEAIGATEPVDLAALADACWIGMDPGPAELRVETNGAIIGDASRVRQLLENLFRNAIAHGGADVTVRIGDTPTGFYVEDNGPGIPDDIKGTVFDVGFSTRDGAGLGLRIVDQIASGHGWSVRIEDAEGGGARFVFADVERAD